MPTKESSLLHIKFLSLTTQYFIAKQFIIGEFYSKLYLFVSVLISLFFQGIPILESGIEGKF